MIPVAEAIARVRTAFAPTGAEFVGLADAGGRVLAADQAARRTQPPVAVSAMDGWAVRAVDVGTAPTTLAVIGQSAAGHGFAGRVGPGQAVRIFTGAPVPDGSDSIILQEDATADGDRVTFREAARPNRHIRGAGIDFTAGQVGLTAGTLLDARGVALAAAMNIPALPVHRRPRVAILATGDELVRPGDALGPNQIVSSNSYGVAALVRAAGGDAIDLGIAPDRPEELAAMAAGAAGCDLLVTLGGASVGDHDLVQQVLAGGGARLDFWKIAMRPGKPLMFGRLANGIPLLGLPGNPVSALVCALLFLRPALNALLGRPDHDLTERLALGRALPENDQRQDYLRAAIELREGVRVVMPFEKQDSSMLSTLAAADGLVIREPHAPAAPVGTFVDILRFPA